MAESARVVPRRPAFRSAVVGAAAALALSGLVACSSPETGTDELTLTIAAGFQTGNWDPIQGGQGYYEWQAVYDSLAVWRPEEQRFDTRLATELTLSEDGRTLTMRLRDDVDFVDGEHLTAAGAAEYFTALLASDQYVYGGNVAEYGVEFAATDEYTLEMSATKRIYLPDFYALLGFAPVLSPAALDDPEAAKAAPVGSGPYLLGEVVAESEMRFVRNPEYWDPEAYPYDRIVLKIIPDAVAQLNALKSGQVDATPLNVSYVAEAEAAGMTITESLGLFRTLWVYDPVNSPVEAFRDVRVRQAMMYAFDRETIAATLDRGYGRVSSQAFNPGQPEYIEGGDDRYDYDPEKARRLMAEAGYADGIDVVIASQPGGEDVEPVVQQSLGDIGIRVTFERLPDRVGWFRAISSGQYPVALEPFQGPLYTLPVLVTEYPGYGRLFAHNDEIEALIERIEQGDPEDSAAASQEIGALLLDEAWYIPFSRPSGLWASIPEVEIDTSSTEVTLPARPELRHFRPAD